MASKGKDFTDTTESTQELVLSLWYGRRRKKQVKSCSIAWTLY